MSKWFKITEKLPPIDLPVWVQLSTPPYYDDSRDCQVTGKTEILPAVRRVDGSNSDDPYFYVIYLQGDSFEMPCERIKWEWGEVSIIEGWQKMVIPKPMEV